MGFLDTLTTTLCDATARLQGALGWRGTSFTPLYTSDADGILVGDEQSMVSLIRLDGSMKLVGDEEFSETVDRLVEVLSVTLSKKCHAVQFVLEYDPEAIDGALERQFAPVRNSAKTLDLDLGDVLDDWRDNMGRYCSVESVFIAVWTRPTAITSSERKQEARQNRGQPRLLVDGDTQGRKVVIERMRDIHLSQVNNLVQFFEQRQYKVKLLDSHAAARVIRRSIDPDGTAENWRPYLPGDPLPVRKKDPGRHPRDVSHIMPPSLRDQIWPGETEILERKYLRVGNRIYAPFVMELPPQTIHPFNELFQGMKGSVPWRASILLTGDGMTSPVNSFKRTIAPIISFASLSNKLWAKSYDSLSALQLEGACMVSFQASFTTWVDKNRVDKPLLELSRRSARLQTAVQSWGSSQTIDTIGDPLFCFSATVPGFSPNSPAQPAVAPLLDAVDMLPMSRPCSPWEHTDLPLRTPDGRFMPVGLFHSNMASWNEIAFAGMGAGKSFFLNTLNLFFILRPGQTRLPWLTVIDIGPSCSGVINLIKSALPPEKRHLAVFAKLRNVASRSINPFDTPLGCPYPLRNHSEYLNNLLSLICTPLDKTAPVDGVPALLREAVQHVYREFAPRGPRPKRFDPHVDPEVTDALRERQYQWDNVTTWWEVVDYLFEEGAIPEAIRAQRFAMPLIADLAAAVKEQNVSENFQAIHAGEGGESVPDACSRYLLSAINEYPMLSNPTKFALGAAQIVGLDLQEVTPRGGQQAQRQSGIMYMLARFVGSAHFFNTVDDLEQIPAKYREYHRPRFESLISDPKRLCYDEFHRASCTDMANPLSRQIMSDLMTASRESRKLNLSIGLYSQQLGDFPEQIVSLSTSIYALGAGNAQEARDIAHRFGYNNAALYALRHITRPTAAGANFIAMFRTADGESILYLTNSAGGYARWAFSTTAEDMRLRNRLFESIGSRRTIEVLHRMFPEGSVKPEIERRKLQMEFRDGEASEDLGDAIYEEVMAYVHEHNL